MAIKVLSTDTDYVNIPYIKGKNVKGVVWPGMGSKFATFNYFEMVPGDENVPHVHWHSEDIFYILAGEGYVVDLDSGEEQYIKKGSIVFVEPGTRHTVKVTGTEPYSSIGGPCPPDPEMFARAGVMEQVEFGAFHAAYQMLKTACAVDDDKEYDATFEPADKVMEVLLSFVSLAGEKLPEWRTVLNPKKRVALGQALGWEAPAWIVAVCSQEDGDCESYKLYRTLTYLEIGAKALGLMPRIELPTLQLQEELADLFEISPASSVKVVVGLGYPQ